MCILTAALRAMGKFVPMVHRRAFLFSICQNIFWPLFFIHTLSDTPLVETKQLYYAAARALCRTPKFVDINTVLQLGALETFDNLVTRHTVRKLTSISARAAFARHQQATHFDLSDDLFKPLARENKQSTRYNLRFSRGPRPLLYKRPILSSVLAPKRIPSCDLSSAVWVDNNVFQGLSTADLKPMVNHHLREFEIRKRFFIKHSFNWTDLKNTESIQEECKRISAFIESRRAFWNFIPDIGTFNIEYKN